MNATTRKPGRINWTNLITVASASILIGTMIVGLGLATAWAIAGTLGLGDVGTTILEALFAVVALVGLVAFWRTATKVEPVVER
jgi:hypothetical protein